MTDFEELDDPADVLRQTRERFVAAFRGRCRSLAILLDALARLGPSGPLDASRRIAHQTRGVAGTLGFPTVSARAGDLEQLILAVPRDGADRATMHAALDRVRAAFEADVLRPPPEWATPAQERSQPHASKILVVVDDAAARDVVTAAMRGAGYRVLAIEDGAEAFDTARLERPDLVLLDVDLRGADPYSICRRLKTSVDLAVTPVLFLTSATVDDRRTGLALGADGYLVKPVEARDLTKRIQQLLEDRARGSASSPADDRLLSYEAFVLAAQESLNKAPGSLALVRLPRDGAAAAIDELIDRAGPRDFVGRFNDACLLVFMPEPWDLAALLAGVATSTAPGATIEGLINEADQALNDARVAPGSAASQPTGGQPGCRAGAATILLADDDPDMQRVARMALRRAQFDVTIVANGRDALARAAEIEPDLVILDWMMPEMDGFEVCKRLKANPATRHIPVIFLTGASEESEMARGLALGAIGYISKPFNALTLGAQVQALMKM